MSEQEEINQKYHDYLNSEPWKIKARQRVEIDKGICQGCGSKGSSLNPLNVHHLNYHHIFHEDVYKDTVLVCRSCHCILHNVLNRVIDENGKRGWRDNPNVPDVNTFVLSGYDLQTRKGNFDNAKGNIKEV